RNTSYQNTPLHEAIYHNKMDITELLLKAGADVNAIGDGKVPLITATLKNNIAIVNLLLNYGAAIEGRGQKNDTALHIAAGENNLSLISLLLDRGANIEAQ